MTATLRNLVLIIFEVLVICLEHTFNLPFLSLLLAVFLFAYLPLAWRNVLIIVGGIVLATVYLIPFWLGLLIFFGIRVMIEFLPFDQRYQHIRGMMFIFGSIAVIGGWTRYPFTRGNLLLVVISALMVISLLSFFIRRRQPRQRLHTNYEK